MIHHCKKAEIHEGESALPGLRLYKMCRELQLNINENRGIATWTCWWCPLLVQKMLEGVLIYNPTKWAHGVAKT